MCGCEYDYDNDLIMCSRHKQWNKDLCERVKAGLRGAEFEFEWKCFVESINATHSYNCHY